MANLGIALGAGTSSFMDTLNKGMLALQQIRDYRRQSELDQAMQGIPQVGDEDTSGQKTALTSEAQRLGVTLDPSKAIPDQLAAVNQARAAQGGQGDFTLPTARKYTAEDRAAAVAAALERSADPHNIALASSLRTQSLQNKAATLQMNRDQFADAARRAVFMAKAGDNDGAMAQVQNAYNNFFPDGGSIQLSKDGDHIVGNVTTADGKNITLRAANAEEMANMAYSLSSSQAYEAMLGRQHQEKMVDKQVAGHLAAARIGAGATIAAANIHAAAEKYRMDTLAPYYKAEVDRLNSQTAATNDAAGAAKEIRGLVDEFTSKLAADPTDPALPALANKLAAKQGKDALVERTVEQDDPNNPGQKLRTTVQVNKYSEMLRSMQPAPVSPKDVDDVNAYLLKKTGGKPMSPADLQAAAKYFDAKAGRPGTFEHNILPHLSPSLLPGGGEAPSAAPTLPPAARDTGRPAPSVAPPRQAIPSAPPPPAAATGGAAAMVNPANPSATIPPGASPFRMPTSPEPTVNPALAGVSNAQLNGVSAGTLRLPGITPDQARLELDARMEAMNRRTRGLPGG